MTAIAPMEMLAVTTTVQVAVPAIFTHIVQHITAHPIIAGAYRINGKQDRLYLAE